MEILQLDLTPQPFTTQREQTLHTVKLEHGRPNISLFVHAFGESHNSLLENKFINDLVTKNESDFLFYDLLGHGLSSGKRGSIDSFSDYVESLKDLIEDTLNNYNKVKIYIWGNSCLLGLAFFKKYFLLTNEKIEEIIFVDPYFHSNKKLMSFLFQIELPEGMEELYEMRRSSAQGVTTETLTWNFWKKYLKAFENIGEALYFVQIPIKFIETEVSERAQRTISALKKLIIHTQCDHIYYNNKENDRENT